MPPAERIATFDNDGTLWSEEPIYFQFAFARSLLYPQPRPDEPHRRRRNPITDR